MVFVFSDVSEGETISVHCTINLFYIYARTVAFSSILPTLCLSMSLLRYIFNIIYHVYQNNHQLPKKTERLLYHLYIQHIKKLGHLAKN